MTQQPSLDGTNCCTTDSKRLHQCCHLLNNLGSHWIFPILHYGLGDAPKIASSPGGSRHPSNTWLHQPYPKWYIDPFSHFSKAHGCVQQRDRQAHTDHATRVTITTSYALQSDASEQVILHCVEMHVIAFSATAFSALTLTLLVGWHEGRIQPVKKWVVGCWHGYLSGARCRLAYSPADATATHCLLLHQNPDWFYLSGTGSPR